MKKKKIVLFLILTLLWMGIVFCFSAENAAVSKQTSLSVMEKIADIFNINITNKAVFEDYLRSFAHLSLFLLGGMVSYALFLLAVPKKKYLYCAIFGFSYALLDEIHQFFVPGRAFELKDICIDVTGFFIGVMIVVFIDKISRFFIKTSY